MSAMNELKRLLKEAQEQQKSNKEEIRIVQEEVRIVQEEDNSLVSKTASYLSAPRKIEPTPVMKIEPTPVMTENIEAQRWNDPLRREAGEKFVTFKEMNDHYGLFLQRIQQQMSSIGGGGEVNLRYLDDLNFSTSGTNKYLTYDQATKKFIFDTVETGEGLYLNGGNAVALSVASSSALGGIKIGSTFTLDGSNRLQLNAATNEIIGGIKLGPGVTTNIEGQIIIDSEGLDFNFGDFEAITGTYSSNTSYALLSSSNVDEDIVLASNGTGDIKVVGGFEVYVTNGSVTGSLEDEEPIFRILDDGQVRILVPLADTTEGGMEIIGSELGTSLAPGQAGTMLHLTGNADLPTRVYHDCLGDYNSYVFRRYNGSVITPTQVLANEDIGRFNWTASNNAGMPNQATAQIRVTALENQTTTAQGSKMVFTLTPVGSPTSSRVDVATISTADGVSATKFTGPLTGNVTGNVSGTAGSVAAANVTGTTLASNVVTSSLTTLGTLTNLTVTNTISGSINGNANTATTSTNLAAATSILAGSVSIDPASINKTSAATQTFTVSGLTTSHKIVITPGTALPYGLMIAGAWVSALNTLSIVFHNYGGNLDQGATTIQYFAWV